MKAGYFIVSKEIINEPIWPECKAEIDKVFKEVCQKEIGYGLVEIHGESELFDNKVEGESQKYECIVTSKAGKVDSIRFEKV